MEVYKAAAIDKGESYPGLNLGGGQAIGAFTREGLGDVCSCSC